VRWIVQNISAKRISTVLYSLILCVHVLIDERSAFLFIFGLLYYVYFVVNKTSFVHYINFADMGLKMP